MYNLNEKWLDLFKLQIRYPYNNQDELFLGYLEISLINILTQYLEIPEKSIDQAMVDEISNDKRVMIATFHLANSIYSNPDLNNVNNFGSWIDGEMLFRILGNKINYFEAYPSTKKNKDK